MTNQNSGRAFQTQAARQKIYRYGLAGLTALGLAIATLASPFAAQAQIFTPPDRGLPGRRVGGGTRGDQCTSGSPARLITLLPETNLGLTTDASPDFAWYLPPNQAEAIEFSLYEVDPNQPAAAERLVYQAAFNPNSNSGIARLSLPTGVGIPPLEVGKFYQWSVSIICNVNNPGGGMHVTGWVQRVRPDPALVSALRTASGRDRVTLYAQNGLWFDAFNALADLRTAAPNDPTLRASWREFLGSVGLEQIAEQPLMGDGQ